MLHARELSSKFSNRKQFYALVFSSMIRRVREPLKKPLPMTVRFDMKCSTVGIVGKKNPHKL